MPRKEARHVCAYRKIIYSLEPKGKFSGSYFFG
jgi:hypothetical protein